MAFCKNCGSQLADGVAFCANCGQKVDQPAPASQPTPTPAPAPAPAPKPKKEKPALSWDGGILDTIVNSIVASLIITFTCGIATPWAICYIWKYILGHAIIDGKRLKFTGTGGDLFGNWIKWFLLTIITCGIYSFWVTPRLYNWIASNTHIDE